MTGRRTDNFPHRARPRQRRQASPLPALPQGGLPATLTAIPHRLLPQVLTLFEVWQNAIADSPNPISAMIVEHAASWLSELEQRQERMGRFQRRDEEEPADPWSEGPQVAPAGASGLSNSKSTRRRQLSAL